MAEDIKFLGYDPKLELTCQNNKLKINTGTTIEETVKLLEKIS
ncbi:hypothetical protein [Clostridium saudiense]|nr:hypothetical protein [Clostridium saudiense]